MPSDPKGWISWLATRIGRKVVLLVVVVAAFAVWTIVVNWHGLGGKPELLVYQLCVGREKGPCPKDTTFVQNVGEETVAKWAQKECAGYKARRIIINDGPTKDCDCFLADVRCSSE